MDAARVGLGRPVAHQYGQGGRRDVYIYLKFYITQLGSVRHDKPEKFFPEFDG
jgi:hypothetical protein